MGRHSAPEEIAQSGSDSPDGIRAERAHIAAQLAQIRATMRESVDVFGAILLGVAVVAFIAMVILTIVSFKANQLGLALLFSAFVVGALPLIAFASIRTLSPIYRLSRRAMNLVSRDRKLAESLRDIAAREAEKRQESKAQGPRSLVAPASEQWFGEPVFSSRAAAPARPAGSGIPTPRPDGALLVVESPSSTVKEMKDEVRIGHVTPVMPEALRRALDDDPPPLHATELSKRQVSTFAIVGAVIFTSLFALGIIAGTLAARLFSWPSKGILQLDWAQRTQLQSVILSSA